MDVQPASIAQITRGKDGRLVGIDEDVGQVAARLRELDPSLRLRYSPPGEYFVVYQETENSDGSRDQHLVLTAQELDGRIVRRVQRIVHPSYDYAEELDAVDRARDGEIDHRFTERIGEAGERLAHAIRKDTGHKGRIAVPGREKG